MTSSAFSNQPGGLDSEGGFYDDASPAGWSLPVDGGTSKLRRHRVGTAERLWPADFHYALHLRGGGGGGLIQTGSKNLFCHKRLSITHRESDYGWLSTDLVIHEGDWQHKRRHEWRDKKERSKETRHRPVTCTLLILETDLLLEWSVRCCPSVTFLASARRPSMWGQTSWPVPLPASHSPPCSDWSTWKADIWANSRQSRTHAHTHSRWCSRREDVPVDCVRLRLRRVLDVGLIQQLLDTQQDLKRASGILRSDRRWIKRCAVAPTCLADPQPSTGLAQQSHSGNMNVTNTLMLTHRLLQSLFLNKIQNTKRGLPFLEISLANLSIAQNLQTKDWQNLTFILLWSVGSSNEFFRPVWWWWQVSSPCPPPGWTNTRYPMGRRLGGILVAQTCLSVNYRTQYIWLLEDFWYSYEHSN